MVEFQEISDRYKSLYDIPYKIQNKIICYEYLTMLFIEWYNEVNSSDISAEQHLSKLSLSKLLFFTSNVGAKENEDIGLFDIFDNYYIAPFGHLEIDINDNNTKCFSYGNNHITEFSLPNIGYFDKIPPIIKHRLVSAVEKLKAKNQNLVLLKAYDLVEISQLYFSWRSYYKKIRQSDISRMSVSTKLLQYEEKFYN